MPQTPTPNRGLPAPAGTDTADGPDAFDELRQALDNVAGIGWGTISGRPAASMIVGTDIGMPGTFYWATDTNQLSLSIDGQWLDLAGASSPPIPIGASLEYAGSGDPTDGRFLLEDGRELLRAGTYAPLYAVLANTYGAGNGSTTFNIPDSRGRVAVGPDNMGTARGAAGRLPNNPNGLGNVGGEERHLLTSGESGMVTHNHGGSTSAQSADHTHGIGGTWLLLDVPGGLWLGGSGTRQGTGSVISPSGITASHVHTIPNQAADDAQLPHNNLQPYVVKNKIIRVR